MPHTVDLPKSADITRSRLPSLTGLRFIAALMVFLFHAILYGNLFSSPETAGTLGSVTSGGGWTGVAFFFVLSGFVLTWSVRGTDTVPKFWRRRLFKIFPNHLVTAIIAFALLVTVAGAALDGNTVLNLLLLQSWVPNMQTVFTGNVVAWSLSCELLFYLSFPLLMSVIGRIRPERLWAWAGGVVAVIFLVPTLAALLPPAQALAGPAAPVIDVTPWQQWFVAFFPPVRMLEFAFGMILARIVITGRRIPLSLGGAVAFAIAAYALTPLFPGTYRVAATMVIPLGLVIVAGAVVDTQRCGGWLSSRTMVFLGDISFAFYMCHWLVLDYGHRLLGQTTNWSTPAGLAVLALLFAGALLAATLLYTCVERPIMRRFASSRRQRLTAVPAETVPARAAETDRLAG